jgi:hypothetical protein
MARPDLSFPRRESAMARPDLSFPRRGSAMARPDLSFPRRESAIPSPNILSLQEKLARYLDAPCSDSDGLRSTGDALGIAPRPLAPNSPIIARASRRPRRQRRAMRIHRAVRVSPRSVSGPHRRLRRRHRDRTGIVTLGRMRIARLVRALRRADRAARRASRLASSVRGRAAGATTQRRASARDERDGDRTALIA